jgi:hypothetical protein
MGILEYVYKDLQIQRDLASNYTSLKDIRAKVKKLVQYSEKNRDKGLFLIDDKK